MKNLFRTLPDVSSSSSVWDQQRNHNEVKAFVQTWSDLLIAYAYNLNESGGMDPAHPNCCVIGLWAGANKINYCVAKQDAIAAGNLVMLNAESSYMRFGTESQARLAAVLREVMAERKAMLDSHFEPDLVRSCTQVELERTLEKELEEKELVGV